jgi:hypothetical protein
MGCLANLPLRSGRIRGTGRQADRGLQIGIHDQICESPTGKTIFLTLMTT